MKKLKKYLCLCGLVFASVALFVFLPNNSNSSASASSISSTFHNLVTVSCGGQVLTENCFFDGDDDLTYIYCNGAVSFNINPFAHNYTEISFDTTDYISTKSSITVESSSNSFEFQGTTYYFSIASATNILSIYSYSGSTSAIASTDVTNSDILSYEIDSESETITITYTYIYTLLSNADDSTLTVKTSDGLRDKNGLYVEVEYNLYILRPKVNFSNASNEVVYFTTYDNDGSILEQNDTIQKEQTFEQVQIEFLEDSYTKQNPLYFSINYNGFTYTYKLYSETYDEISYLFVEYYDDNNSSNSQNLASTLDESETPQIETGINADNNNFYMIFTETGRYSFEIYDSTYLYSMENPNYYSTTFYIIDKGTTVTTFDNLYIIAQILDDEGNEIEYIVSDCTLNNDVYVTIKNLTNLEDGETLEDIVDRIEIVQALLTGSNNKPSTTTYTISEIKEMIDENGDLNLLFNEDAYYEIHIYPKDSSLEEKYYNFTLVTQAKTSFTISYSGEVHEATIPYYTETIGYSHQINSSLKMSVKFTTQEHEIITFDKSYTNEYVVYYGMEQVSIVKAVTITTDDEGNEVEEDDGTSITLEFYGVGDLTVNIEINGITTTYYLNYENGNYTLTFTEYGTYNVTLVDSMGSSTSGSFTLSKSLSVSAIILIVLVCIIVAFIVVFIVRIRANVKTR